MTQDATRAKTKFPVVYLPIEFQSREFDSKALLAATLAERGYVVVVGQQWLLYEAFSRLPPGVILFKSFNKFHQAAMAPARQRGHRILVLDEELLAQTERKAVEALCTEGIFGRPDLILVDGVFEHDILARLSGGKVRIEIVGNGRIDLLKPKLRPLFQDKVNELTARFGRFVLINTNFSILNSIWQSTEQVTRIQVQAGFTNPNDAASLRLWQDYIDCEQANLNAMHVAIRELARRRPQQRIVVRPHPGEDLRKWDGLFSEHPNVAVIREGPHMPWTLASELLLHTSCTTGFEAYVAGKTALSLTPRPSWITSSLISNHVNPTFEDPLALVAAAEAILDGGQAPEPASSAEWAEQYVWNCRDRDATPRVADCLTEGMPAPATMTLPGLRSAPLDPKLRTKYDVSLRLCSETVQKVRSTLAMTGKVDVQEMGDGLFVVAPAGRARIEWPPKLDAKQIRAAMEAEMRSGRHRNAYEIFRANFGEAHRHGELCFFAGVACFEAGDYKLALQCLQQSSVAANSLNISAAMLIARTFQKLQDYEMARRYARLTYIQSPTNMDLFRLLRETSVQAGEPPPQHWLVIGCSHVRYFRYMQVNQPRFFDAAVHLECYEFAGATAFGLGNISAETGALKATRQLRPNIAQADRVLINFGEIDCRRAAWKAAVDSGRTIEQTIADSAAQLEKYVSQEILPYNKRVILIGAKPQIIGDNDFYKNALADERTVFRPLEERERITNEFNRRLKAFAAGQGIGSVDLDDELATEQARQKFFSEVFWDTFTDDTHGNADFFARLYFDRLTALAGLAKAR